MAKLPRAIAAGHPHHITQRGNRRQTTFFEEPDYALYVELLNEYCCTQKVSVWAWCLMPNHVHIIAAPATASGLTKAIADTHRRYSWIINRRMNWRGNLWQSRFSSCIMDEPHSILALRYVERNPDRAGLCQHPEEWPWSSARKHLGLPSLMPFEDTLTDCGATSELVTDWQTFLNDTPPIWQIDKLRQSTRTGRPIGSNPFIDALETQIGRNLRPKKQGRKRAKPAT